MNWFGVWCFVIQVVWGLSSTDMLFYYETLLQTHFQHKIVRRSVETQHQQQNHQKQQQHEHRNNIRHLSFEAHGRTFIIHLKQSNGIYSTDFKAYRVRKEGTPDKVNMDRKTFYAGHLVNEVLPSSVFLHIINDHVISGYIKTTTDTFIIEPIPDTSHSGNHRNDVEHDNSPVIIYRESDVKADTCSLHSTQFNDVACTYYKESTLNDKSNSAGLNVNYKPKSRLRRSASKKCDPKKFCTLLLIADYLYYRNVGGGNVERTIYFMLQAINFADRIFTDTDWHYKEACFNVGVVVKNVFVYVAPSNKTGPR